jgi:hypothetical protein
MSDNPEMDEVLKRMLNTPPKPHKDSKKHQKPNKTANTGESGDT